MGATNLEAVAKSAEQSTPKLSGNNDTLKTIQNRKVNQLYIGITGPIGSGASLAANILKEQFVQAGYEPVLIKVSELIIQNKVKGYADEVSTEKSAKRIIELQKKGNAIRKNSIDGIGKLICDKIVKHKKEAFGEDYEKVANLHKSLEKKIVYIIDSLKSPYDVQLLKEIYKNSFYLFGILSLEETCKERFVAKGYDPAEFSNIFTADAGEGETWGQQVRKILQDADIFIDNNKTQRDELERKIERYISLITRRKVVTPTRHETAMHHAYVAGARSACLSRQVGAAIVSPDGNVISTGCNDVPKALGGLYTSEDANDQRCFNKGAVCYNDQEKKILYTEILKIMKPYLKEDLDQKSLDESLRKTKIKDLIEFSRAVHAEMDAIVKIASDSGTSTRGAVLYTTTFPCHNCARHILAAGISKVYYIEPYIKSLAPKLHEDAIALKDGVSHKVGFLPYEGVAPRRYLYLFEKQGWKDKQGTLDIPDGYRQSALDRIQIDSFFHLERKVVSEIDFLEQG